MTNTTNTRNRLPIAGLALTVAIGLLATACSGDDDDATTTPTSAGVTSTSLPAPPDTAEAVSLDDAQRISDGMYRRVITTADGETVGMDPESAAEWFGPDGEMPLGLRIDGGGYEILVTNDAGVEEVGDVGTVEYGDDGRLQVVDSLGGHLTIDWMDDDGLLTTELLGDGHEPDALLVWTGEWVLAGAEADVQSEDVQVVPDGTYRRVTTTADAEALGLEPEEVTEFVGDDGEYPVALRFDGDRIQLLVTNDADIEEVGVDATIEYDEDGRLIVHEGSLGDSTIEWTYEDGVLVTELVADAGGSPAHPVGQLHLTGEWTLEGYDADGETADGDMTLTFANPLSDLPPQIIAFLTEARDAMGEAITWDVAQSAGPEQEIIESVVSGDVDMAWVGARAFPEFDALLAPTLVDSYELQAAVFEEGMVDRLADTLAARGLKVLAVYPGPLQRAVGVDQVIATAGDFEGREIGLGHLDHVPPLQVATIEALGATPATFREHMDISVLDGFIAQIGAVSGNSWENEVASVTTNLNFWPRPLVVITSLDRFEELDGSMQEALISGGVTAFDAAATATLEDDQSALGYLCGATAELVELGDADLAEIRARLAPVYAALAENPTTGRFLAEIEALKAELAIPPTVAACDGA